MKLQVLCDNANHTYITPQFFLDLKRLYAAYDRGQQPSKMLLNRLADTMIQFMAGEVRRTTDMLDAPELAQNETFQKMLEQYREVHGKLVDARMRADYKGMMIQIDQAISLNHWYGSVLDNLVLCTRGNTGRVDSRAEAAYEQLARFLRSIGRLPRLNATDLFNSIRKPNGKIDYDRLTSAIKRNIEGQWRIGDTGEKVSM